jgi:CRP-like cAMP-binding protein
MNSACLETNVLLRALEPFVRTRFSHGLETFDLRRAKVLHDQGEAVEWVYFPRTALVAILSETLDGECVESAMVGWDGAVGAFEACGSRQSFSKAVVQIPGQAIRVRAVVYREMFDHSRSLRTAMHKYMEVLLAEARQLAACNALHMVEGRLSRSILDTFDRSLLGQVLPLTQESLAQKLGAQRTTIAACISKLQRDGLIRSGRGAIEILDAAGLERSACSCRKSIEFARHEIQSSGAQACEAMLPALGV